MIRLCVICEGPTEAEFVKQVLYPHLLQIGILTRGSILQARSGSGKGGRVTVERVAEMIRNEYPDSDRITTFVDFYGFKDRLGRNRARLESDIMAATQTFIGKRFNDAYVLPYVQMHEFEALLFADVRHFAQILGQFDDAKLSALQEIRAAFDSPEHINDSFETAPSKRLERLFTRYKKPLYGSLIASKIGLGQIRAECKQFDKWLQHIEAWVVTNKRDD
jgi:hypothetical protein